MSRLENVIKNTLDKFKNSQMNLLSERARQVLVIAIAEALREEVEKQKKDPSG